MVCLPPGAKGDTAIGGVASIILAMLRWLTAQPIALMDPVALATLDQPPVESTAVSDPFQAQCEVAVAPDWKLHCGMEMNIFTSGEPDDLLAIASLFQQATSMANAQKCKPSDYPIKAIFTGNGANSQASYDWMKAYLSDLTTWKLMPSTSWFDPRTQVFQGPGSYGPDAPTLLFDYTKRFVWSGAPFDRRYKDRFWGMEQVDKGGPLPQTFRYLPQMMDILIGQTAPVIVAMRPLMEFAVIWAEALRRGSPGMLATSAHYENAKPTGVGAGAYRSRYALSESRIRRAMEAFQRSRLTMYNETLKSSGEFFETQIMDSSRSTDSAKILSTFQEMLVTIPKQTLIVDREGILRNKGLRRRPIFTTMTQRGFWYQLGKLSPTAFRLYYFIQHWNEHAADLFRRMVMTRLVRFFYDSYPDRHPPLDEDHGKLLSADALRNLIHESQDLDADRNRPTRGKHNEYFNAVMEKFLNLDEHGEVLSERVFSAARASGESWSNYRPDPEPWVPVRAAVEGWQNQVADWRTEITSRLRHLPPFFGGVASRMKQALGDWVRAWEVLTLNRLGWVRAENMMLPFVFSLESSLVGESFEQVSYGGKNAQGYYEWPAADATSSVWITRGRHDLEYAEALAREERMMSELGTMYTVAFTPPPPGSDAGA